MTFQGNSNESVEDATIDGVCPKSELGTGVDPDLLSACIHCGLCLPACPTYLATGREMESPRGRIYLLGQWLEGQHDLRIAEHIDSCLGCYGCQTACPSGVQYAKILEQARVTLAPFGNKRTRRLLRFVFKKILPDYKKLQNLGKLLRVWQMTGGSKIANKIPWLKKSMGPLLQWQSFLPSIPKYVPLPKKSWMSGVKQGEVNLFVGCVMDVLYNQVNHACQRLLMGQRQIVSVPEQTCCGALAAHAGEADIAKELAKKNIELFENVPGEIVVTSAGCGAMLKEYKNLLSHEDAWQSRAQAFSNRVVDITEFLAAHQFVNKPNNIKRKVAYHAACHLYHAQKIQTAPEVLLGNLEGIEIVQLKEAEHCCGSAGIFNLTHSDLSLKILETKIKNIIETGADEVVTTNPGCMLQIESGISAIKSKVKVRHLAELLDEAYSQEN